MNCWAPAALTASCSRRATAEVAAAAARRGRSAPRPASRPESKSRNQTGPALWKRIAGGVIGALALGTDQQEPNQAGTVAFGKALSARRVGYFDARYVSY